MTPQELKASILQLAIQGKLVEQRPEEGTGEELYRQIQAEKQRLVKAGKIKKEKPLPEITDDEIPFEIPGSWKWVRLRTAVYNRGQTIPQERFAYIDIGSIDNRRQRLNSTDNLIEADKAPSRARKIVANGDILYSTVRPYLHNMCIIDRKFQYTPIASTGFAAMTCHCGLFNKFLFYYLLSPAFDAYANASDNSKGVAYPAINDDKLYRAIVPLPPLAEQKRIVAKIEELLPYIDRYEKAWGKLEDFNRRFPVDMQKSLLQMAIQGKLVEQRPEEGTGEELYRQIQAEKQRLVKAGKIKKEKPLPEITEEEIPFEIPQGWKWVRLGEVADVQLGKMLDKGKNKGKQYPYLANLSVRWGAFDLSTLRMMPFSEDECEKFSLLAGDVLMCEGGVPGRCAVWREENSPIKYQKAVHRIRSQFLFPDFIQLFFQAICDSSRFASLFTGTTIKHLPRVALIQIPLPLPPLAEQKRIVAKLEELMPLCERLKE